MQEARFVRWLNLWARVALAAMMWAGCGSGKVAAPADAATMADAHADVPAQCGDGGAESLAACADRERYVADVAFIAGERTPGSAHWKEVQDLCANRLTSLGYQVERQVYATGVNVVGVRRGIGTPDERVLISAHYDHIRGCAGADDNGSGVAAVLEVARILASRAWDRTLVAACWDEEERRSDDESTNGSRAYARRARARGESIVDNMVLDAIGYASSEAHSQSLPAGLESVFATQVQQIQANGSRGDFLLAVLDSASHGFGERLVTSAQAAQLPTEFFELPVNNLNDPALEDLRRSDHSAFWDEGYPGLLVTDTANFRNPRYHCENGPDTADSLDYVFAMRVVRALSGALVQALGEP